jgi:hypothetical protein
MVLVYDYKLKLYSSIRDNGLPRKYAYYGGEWDTGGLFGETKCVYNKTDGSDNR